MILITKDGEQEGVTKSKLFEDHRPKVVDKSSDIEDIEQHMKDLNQVIYCYDDDVIYVFKDGKEVNKIKLSEI